MGRTIVNDQNEIDSSDFNNENYDECFFITKTIVGKRISWQISFFTNYSDNFNQ